jgi:hypothetical protein
VDCLGSLSQTGTVAESGEWATITADVAASAGGTPGTSATLTVSQGTCNTNVVMDVYNAANLSIPLAIAVKDFTTSGPDTSYELNIYQANPNNSCSFTLNVSTNT